MKKFVFNYKERVDKSNENDIINHEILTNGVEVMSERSVVTRIKMALAEQEMSISELAAKVDHSPQNLTQKFCRQSISAELFIELCDKLGYDVIMINRGTGNTL